MRTGRLTAVVMLLAGLLVACADVQVTITLPDGSAVGPGPAAAPRGYSRLFSPAPHAFVPVADPVRRGQRAERYELRAGDCGGSDCGQPRARAEIVQDPDTVTARLNRDIWIGWSFRNANIPAVTRNTWLGTTLGQWKLAGDQPAIFRLLQVAPEDNNFAACPATLCTQAGTSADDVMLDLDEMAQANGWGPAQNNGRICRLFSLTEYLGEWVDITINTNFGTDAGGYLRIWVNGELRCNYIGPLVSAAAVAAAGPGAQPTHRRGIFHSYTERWTQTQGAAPIPTFVAYYDEYTEGLARSEVEPALRAAAGLAPVQ